MDLCCGSPPVLTGATPTVRPEVITSSRIVSRTGLCCPGRRWRSFPVQFQQLLSAKRWPRNGRKGFQSSPWRSHSIRIQKGDARCSLRSSREIFEVADVAAGALDVQGWKVLKADGGELVGIVDEIIHIGPSNSDEIFESVLKLIQEVGIQGEDYPNKRGSEDDDEGDYLEILVPLVEDIVREVNARKKCLFITPPEGLLELARIPHLLRDLEPQLLEFCRQQNKGIRDCLHTARASENARFSTDAKQVTATTGVFELERLDMFMPTRRQLLAAGRHDLVERIMAAGGFLSVALALNLRSRRRPNGFWEDLRNLDAEIEWFVSGSWSKEEDPETGGVYYRNQATDEVSSQAPSLGSVANPLPVSQDSFDVGTAVMPRQQKVMGAGRYDLHHAILAHGGYKVVAQELGRQPVSKDSTASFVAAIKVFMEEQSIFHVPSAKELRASGRSDLAYLLRRNGGVNGLADMLDIRPKRYGKGHWSRLDDAAAAIRTYICNKLIDKRGLSQSTMDRSNLEDKVWDEGLRTGTLEVPSQSSLLKDDRSDLRYLLQKFGRKALADHLGLVKNQRGSLSDSLGFNQRLSAEKKLEYLRWPVEYGT